MVQATTPKAHWSLHPSPKLSLSPKVYLTQLHLTNVYWAPPRSQEVTLYWGSVCEWDSGPAPEVVIRGKQQQIQVTTGKAVRTEARPWSWEAGLGGKASVGTTGVVSEEAVSVCEAWGEASSDRHAKAGATEEGQRFQAAEMRVWWLREEMLLSACAALGSTRSSRWWRPGRVVTAWARPEGTQEDECGLGMNVRTPGMQSNQECGIPLVQKGAWGAGRKVRRDEELEMQEADGIAGKATSFSGGQTGAESPGGQMRQVTRHLFLRTVTGRWGWTHVPRVWGESSRCSPETQNKRHYTGGSPACTLAGDGTTYVIPRPPCVVSGGHSLPGLGFVL